MIFSDGSQSKVALSLQGFLFLSNIAEAQWQFDKNGPR